MFPYSHFFHPTRLFGTWEYVVPVKSKVEISQNFVAFSEYVNFTCSKQIQYMDGLVWSGLFPHSCSMYFLNFGNAAGTHNNGNLTKYGD